MPNSPFDSKFADIPMSVQDYLIEKGDVFYSCGGITVEDPKLQQCVTHIDEMDRVGLHSQAADSASLCRISAGKGGVIF